MPTTMSCCKQQLAAETNNNSSASNSTSNSNAVRGTSNVLAMLPAGKSCCAENAFNADLGNSGASTGNGNGNMNETSNVLVQYTLQDLDRRAESNFWLGLLCLLVCAINLVLVYLVCMHTYT